MASSSSKDKHNFQCVTEASLELIKLPLKDILRSQIKPEDLFLKIKSSLLLSGKNKLRPDQQKLCYFPPPVLPDYSKFDVTLLYTLIRNLCPGLEPTRGWGNEPVPKDTQIGDDIERLRSFRNNNFAHLSSAAIPDDTFEDLWRTLKAVLNRLKLHSGCRRDYEQDLIEIKRSQFRNEIWEDYRNLWKVYLEIEKEENERVEPGIWIKGEEQVICGDTAEFKAEVKQAESFSFPIKWQRRRGQFVEIIDTTLEKYSGSTNTKLVIPSVCKEDALEYQASLSDGKNHMVYSNTINLHVLGEIPFLNDLEVTVEDEEIKIHYSVGVSENSPHVQDITWSKNGLPMYIEYVKFFGGSLHDSCLIINSPSEDDKGKYSCTVTNAVGSETKHIVLDVPYVAISIKSPVHFASDTTITSIVTSMPPPEKAQWQKSKHGNDFSELEVTKSKYFGSDVGPECPRLIIPQTTFDDMLYYRLRISNKLGVNVSNTVHLNVTGSLPNITVNHETDINNKSIKLTGVVFLSDDSPGVCEVYWSKNGKQIDIQESGGRLSGVSIDDPSLTIRYISQEDVGKYQLTAINAIGSNTSDAISIDAPYVYIVSEKYEREYNKCMCFLVKITSIPSPCHAQWYVKPKGDDKFTPLDVNAEEYQGSTNSLPHPKLVVIEKDQLKKNLYQVKVTNFVGSTVKNIPDNSEENRNPLLSNHSEVIDKGVGGNIIYSDQGRSLKFAELCYDLARHFPPEKFQMLRYLLKSSGKVTDVGSLKDADSVWDCFELLQQENLFTLNDVIFMQFLLEKTDCNDLNAKCIDYAKEQTALCYFIKPPENGYTEVQFHIQGDITNYSKKDINDIVVTVASILHCNQYDILVNGLKHSESFMLLLSIQKNYIWKLSVLDKHDCIKLVKLNIDYLILDENKMFLEISEDQILLDTANTFYKYLKTKQLPEFQFSRIRCRKEFFGRLFHPKEKSSNAYRIHQCFECPEDTEFFCLSCNCDLCLRCKENHVKHLETKHHNVVTYREIFNNISRQEICGRHPALVYSSYCISCKVPSCPVCSFLHMSDFLSLQTRHRNMDLKEAYERMKLQHGGAIHIIKREALYYRQVFLARINSDLKTCHTKLSLFQLDILKKAMELKDLVDYVQNNLVYNMSCAFEFKHRSLKHKMEMTKHLVGLQKYIHIYEQSATSPLQFLSSIKTALHQTQLTLHSSKLSMTESLNKKDVIESLSVHVKQKRYRSEGKECLLKLMYEPELIRSFTLTGVDGCYHISCVASDRVWIKRWNNIILTDTTGITLHRQGNLCANLFGGSHTVNNDGELIYIDLNYNISKLSKDMKETTIFIEKADIEWKPRCVYCSPSTGDLLVGLLREGTETGKVARYSQSGILTQTIEHDSKGLEQYCKLHYITENNNGDVVVSVYPIYFEIGGVVVTESGGKHRFSYTGPPSGSGLCPFGICTDALSNILVCDGLTSTVQMIDKDGHFLSLLLTNPLRLFVPHSLSYDVNSHHLWVGSRDNNNVSVYRYIQQDRMDDTGYWVWSSSRIQKKKIEQLHTGGHLK